MSIHITSKVWSKSQHRGTSLLLMLALADMANDEGQCWPSQKTLAKRARISARNVQLTLRKLAESGEIFVHERSGPNGVNRYEIDLRALGKTVNEDSETGESPEDIFGEAGFGSKTSSPEILCIDDPKEASSGNVIETSDKPNGYDDVPESHYKPYDMWREFCRGSGKDPSLLSGQPLAKQLAIAKRMMAYATPDDMRNIGSWLESTPFWRSTGFDMLIVEKQYGKWAMAGKPSGFSQVTGREKRISGSTPRG